MGQMMICIPYISNYYLCNFFVEIIDNKKIKKNNGADVDVCMLHVKIYTIRIDSEL
jgi:hypothetical protein